MGPIRMIINANATHIPLKDESVHCIVTSPPYFGLRRYQIPDSIWDGEAGCDHQWDEIIVPAANGIIHEGGMSGETLSGSSATRRPQKSKFCVRCGAWKGQLGGEPSISLYVSHITHVFREVRRVLRQDGILWLNLGDSYASGQGGCLNPGGGERSFGKHLKAVGVHPLQRTNISDLRRDGLKPKDLCEIPSEVVRALRADGWWLRSRIPWIKENGMPESVGDRPTGSVEYIFLLTKTARPFYDGVAVKKVASEDSHARYARGRSNHHKLADGGPGNQTILKSLEHMIKPKNWHNAEGYKGQYPGKPEVHGAEDAIAMPDNYRGSLPGRKDGLGQDRRSKKDRLPGVHPKSTEPGTGNRANSSFNAAVKDVVGSRYRRNSDWFFESLQGLLTNQEGEPLAMLVNSRGYAGAHYSTFPEGVVEPCIKAGTSAKGCCPKCGAPWARVVEKNKTESNPVILGGRKDLHGPTYSRHKTSIEGGQSLVGYETQTLGWQPTCSCDAGAPVPCLVLDPFGGSGTVGAVAERLSRRWILLDLGYHDLMQKRLVGIQKEMPLVE